MVGEQRICQGRIANSKKDPLKRSVKEVPFNIMFLEHYDKTKAGKCFMKYRDEDIFTGKLDLLN